MNFPWENNIFPKVQCIFLKERSKFLKEIYVPNLFAITTISCLFLYRLMTYDWKGFKEAYNFVVGNISNQNSYAKITIKQNFKHICSLMNMVAPLGNLSPCSLGNMVVPQNNLNSFSLETCLFPKIFFKKLFLGTT
jgi:hypothetical protein